MADEKQALERMVLTRALRLNATIQGIVSGLVVGLGLFVATIWLVLKGGPTIGPHLSLLGQYLIGYRVSVFGSFIGFAYGFVGGYLVGYIVSRVYNWAVDRREHRRLGNT